MKNFIKMRIALFIFCLFSAGLLLAQPTTMVTYETKLKIADESAKNADYYNAIDWYEKAYEESKDINIQVAIADLYVLARDYVKAERLYDRLLKRDKKNEIQYIRVDYARVLKYQGRYKEALQEFKKVVDTEEDEEILKMAKFEMEGITMMKDLPENIEVVIGFMSDKINSGSAEAAPALTREGNFYFGSFNRKNEIILDGKDSDFFSKIYKAEKGKEGTFDKVTAVNELVNRPDMHTSGVSFSKDGSRMYFTRVELLNNGVKTSKIFYSKKKGDDWGVVTEVEAVNGEFLSMHPIEGELFGRPVLYFSSNMDGTQGGMDIFYSEIAGESFGIPVNLGGTINTPKDELTPFYKDGTLYYSSNGLPSIGGIDIYYSTWSGSAWSKPANMGLNYNSSYDDFYLRFDPAGTSGFLVSNRLHKDKKKMKSSATCCDDIYAFNLRELVIDLQLIVENEKSPLDGATVEVYDLTSGGYPDIKDNPNGGNFSFLLEPDREYKVKIKRDGYFTDSLTISTLGLIDDYSFKRKTKLKEKPKEPETITVAINEAIKLNNIYYDLDDAKILPDAEADLSYLLELMEKYGDMVIELSSHTDARGVSSYNQKLSQRRAESAKNWLVKEGINPDRIKAVGYGESKLLNRCKDGVRCSEEEHRLNRRTEFTIIAGPRTIEIKRSEFKAKDPTKG